MVRSSNSPQVRGELLSLGSIRPLKKEVYSHFDIVGVGHCRDLAERTGGITEFVPLPYVHMEAPLYLKV